MSFTFTQTMNKLQNGKYMTRSSYTASAYLHLLPSMDIICKVTPGNEDNPCQPYNLSISDYNATDWTEVT